MRREWRFLLGLCRGRWLWLAGGAALMGLTVAASVGLLALSGWFLTAAALAGLAGAMIEIYAPGAGIRFFALLRTGARYGERLVTHEAAFRLLADLRLWLFARAIPQDADRLARLRRGDLLNRLTADIEALDGFYLRLLAPVAVAAIAVAGGALLLGWIDPRLGWLVLVLLTLAGAAIPALGVWLARRPGTAQVTETARLRADAVDLARGLGDLLALGAGDGQRRRLIASAARLAGAQRRLAAIAGLGAALSGLAGQMALWGGALIGVALVADGRLDGPMLALVLLAILALFEAVEPLPAALQQLPRLRAAAGRLLDFADAPPRVSDPADPVAPPAGQALALEAVTFAYEAGPDEPPRPPVLRNFTLRIGRGERLGLAGPSGIGKSTVLALLLRQHDPQAGRIVLDGVDLRCLRRADLWARLGVLSQRPGLFDASVRENLLLADPDAGDMRLWQVLEDVGLADAVDALPEGLSSWIGETGTRLSGGQARRLAFARLLLKDPPILLLDEPTAGLDELSAAGLRTLLTRHMPGRTVLLASHRAADLAAMDRVVHLSGRRQP